MPLSDTKTGYGSVSIALHWIGAICIAAMWILGNNMEDLPPAEALAARQSHISVGLALFAILALRIIWRMASGGTRKDPTAAPSIFDRVATYVHYGLLASIAILILSGPLSIWFGGRPLEMFGMVSVPSPFPKVSMLHEGFEVAHVITSKVILPLILLHVAGALKHLLIDRDGVVRRMLVPARDA